MTNMLRIVVMIDDRVDLLNSAHHGEFSLVGFMKLLALLIVIIVI